MPRSFGHPAHPPRSLRWSVLCALVALGATGIASAQSVTFTSRNGEDTAYCGPSGGPVVDHDFSALTATHESISLSDPGGPTWSPSEASVQFDATPTQSGIALAGSALVSRDAVIVHATAATAATRDEWAFTVTAPTRFSFSASLSATSSAGVMAPQVFVFGALGGGAQIILDPGVPPSALSWAIFVPGAFASTATGTLLPGQYYVSLNGRTEGSNVWPYDGSFDNWLSLAFGSSAVTSYCTSGTTTNGCNAQIQGTGTASASATSGFTLAVTGMEGGSQGLIFYGVSGRAAAPWGTSSSFVCVKSPTQRTGAQSGGGTSGACDGAMSLDWNAFVATHPGALGAPFSSGQLVQAQGWFRDPPSPKSTMLSNAIEFVVSP
jgi:hypothetical protein